MARPTVIKIVLCLSVSSAALGGAPATQKTFSPAALRRAQNYVRPGWFLVDGQWARSQATLASTDLFTLIEADGTFHLYADPVPRIDPLLKNGRCSLVTLNDSTFGWKLSAIGRVWNDTRSAGSQHLQLIAAMDDARADATFRLTKIEITPQQQVIQAVAMEDEKPVSVIVVLGQDFIECSAGLFGAAPSTLVRSTTGRQLLIDRPIETRRYVVPLLKLVNDGHNPLMPAAADVYRAFPDLPVDAQMTATIRALVPDLAAADPAIRRRANAELRSLGRPGVHAAMQFDTTGLPIEAAERITSLVSTDSRDGRPPGALRQDSGFILDCLSDPDPNVRVEAAKWIGK